MSYRGLLQLVSLRSFSNRPQRTGVASRRRRQAKVFKLLQRFKRIRKGFLTHKHPWRFFVTTRFDRRPWPFVKRRVRRPRKPRRRYTLKQRPLLKLFLLNAPWRRSRYRLRDTSARLYSHALAFRMYYRVKEGPCTKVVQKVKRQPMRVRSLFEKFERRLDVVLVRLGWAADFRGARSLISCGGIEVSSGYGKGSGQKGSEDYLLRPGDWLHVSARARVTNFIKQRLKKVAWRLKTRCLVPSPKRPKGYNQRLFRKYIKGKRRFPWLRYARFFYYHPLHFETNYNTLVAVYRPGFRLKPYTSRYPLILGPNLEFWKDMLRAC